MTDAKEYATHINPKPISILRALSYHNGEAPTPKISDYTGIDNNNLNYWFRKLANDDAIERTGEEVETAGYPAYVYRITDFGEAIVEEAHGSQLTIDDKMMELDDRIMKVESKSDSVAVLRDSHQELEERVDDLEKQIEKIDELEDRLNKMTRLIKAIRDGEV